jgi:hypothetical protein
MPSLLGTDVATNYRNNVIFNGLGARTVIVKLEKTDMTDDDLNGVVDYLTVSGGDGSGDLETNESDAFTVVAMTSDGGDNANSDVSFVSGESDVVTIALQGTGTVTKAGIEAYSTNLTATILATFDQNYPQEPND